MPKGERSVSEENLMMNNRGINHIGPWEGMESKKKVEGSSLGKTGTYSERLLNDFLFGGR